MKEVVHRDGREAAASVGETNGLTSADARVRRTQFGANAVAIGKKVHPLRQFALRFWAPIPWLLEATIAVQLFLGAQVEAAVIAGLLVVNVALGLLQENRAKRALALLRQQLRVEARVRRDREWTNIVAEELVPDDVVHLRQGRIVPADVRPTRGSLLVDQSALTGESAAVKLTEGGIAYAGSLARGGEATGIVTATGGRTFFGKTAELVRTHNPGDRRHGVAGLHWVPHSGCEPAGRLERSGRVRPFLSCAGLGESMVVPPVCGAVTPHARIWAEGMAHAFTRSSTIPKVVP